MAGQRAVSSNKIVDKLKQIAILTEHNKLTTGAIKRPAQFCVVRLMRKKGVAWGMGFVVLTMRGNPIVQEEGCDFEIFWAGEMGVVTSCIMLGHCTAILMSKYQRCGVLCMLY